MSEISASSQERSLASRLRSKLDMLLSYSSLFACRAYFRSIPALGANHLEFVKLLDLRLQRLLRIRLTVYQKHFLQNRRHRLHPLQKLSLVRMPAQFAD